jgi:hypothetical protein
MIMTTIRRSVALVLPIAACSIPTDLPAGDNTTAVSLAVGDAKLVDFQPGMNVYEVCVGVNQSLGDLSIENATEGNLLMPTTAAVEVDPGTTGADCPTMTGVGATDKAVAWARFRWATALGVSDADVRYVNGNVTSAPVQVSLAGDRFMGYTLTVDKTDQQASFVRFDATLKYADPTGGTATKIAPGVTFSILTLPDLSVEYPTDPALEVTGPTGTTTLIFAAPTEDTQIYLTPQGGELTLLQDIQPTP